MSTPPPFALPRIVVGLWRLADWQRTASETADWTAQCLDQGLSAFDLADVYGGFQCEELFGDALRSRPELRDRMQIVTKCGIRIVSERRPEVTRHHYDTSYEHIVRSAENSLAVLYTDRLDLLLIHRSDALLDADETARAFDDLHRAGKVLAFGASNFPPAQFELLASRVDAPLVTNQIEASVLHLDAFQDGTLDQAQRLRLAPMAWSPLAGGRLFAADQRAERVRAALAEVGAAHGDAPIDTIAFAFLLAHPAGLIPITGSGRLERIRAALDADKLQLTREQWFRIWTASTGEPLP